MMITSKISSLGRGLKGGENLRYKVTKKCGRRGLAVGVEWSGHDKRRK